MKHWDGRDRNDVEPLRLSRRDRQRFAQFVDGPVRPRREPQLASMLGLVLSVAMVAGLAWALWPVGPVDPGLIR